jgi:hypothetical protein
MLRDRGRPIGSPGRLAALLALVALGPSARANGAFPDEFSIHFPANAPHRIYVGANFGLLVSEDDGATWRYACEPWVTEGSAAALTNDNVSFYNLTAGGAAIIALSREITRTEDDACTWPPSSGAVVMKVVTDLFPDPNDATLVLAAVVNTGGSYILASHDGGKTFGDSVIYSSTGSITGLELSASSPGVVYATSVGFSRSGAILARSDDYGAHWSELPLDIPSGTEPLIMGIDPEDANTVYLRVVGALTDSVWITTNAGQSFDTPLTINGQFSSFLRAGDGALYVGEIAGVLHVRAPGSTEFTSHRAPRFRCLGQRPGTSRIFACGDMSIDGFSVGYSDDQGQTFQAMMSFTDLLGPLTCAPVANACQDHWARIQGVLGIGPAPDAGPVGGPDAGPADAGPPPPPSGGGQKSGCSTTDDNGAVTLGLIVVILLLWRVRS